MFHVFRHGFLALLVLVLCTCSSNSKDDADAGTSGGTTGAAGAAGSQPAAGSGDVSIGDPQAICGDGNVDEGNLEECDDGNTDDTDGCTSLCEYSCHSDADCQNDECTGAGSICDPETHACTPATGAKPDGEPCGVNGSCRSGVCVEHACNNGYQEPGEECDDGDQDETNGCTTECKYSCVTGDDRYPQCANDCDLTATCDDTTHACVAGNPLPDNEPCADGGGYCLNGMCVLSVCGDGVQQPNEECDQGRANGAPDSGCTATCTISICGDGIIDEREQCDDGNVTSLDGCDSSCRIELVYRATRFRPSRDDPPDFCVHPANTFGSLMGDDASLMADIEPMMDSMMDTAPMTFMFHVLEVDDPTAMTPDPLIRVGSTIGDPDPNGVGPDGLDWANTTDRLDFPMLIYRQFYDDELTPISIAYAEITVEDGVSVMQTTKPLTMGFEMKGGTFEYQGIAMDLPVGKFVMRDLMMRMEIDPRRSKVPAPPETADVEVPESAGNFDPTGATEATGLMCGALDAEIFDLIGIPAIDLVFISFDPTIMCSDQWGQITACQPGQSPTRGECSSMLDFMQLGCSNPLGVLMKPLGPPDADTDGDGTNDSYTMVMRIASQRVKIAGYSDKEPLGEPIPPEE
jgi:cysteine-rich repeat protein